MSQTIPNDAASALAALSALPGLGQVDMTFTAVTSDSDGGFAGYRLQLSPDAKDEISAFAQSTRDRLSDAGLVAYGPATLIPSQHFMHVSQASAATLDAVQSLVDQQDLLPFTPTYAANSTLKMVAARFYAKDHLPVTFYRIADTLLQLKKARVLGLIHEGGIYTKLEPSDVLLLKPTFDVVVVGGFAFFTLKPTFERAFGFMEELKKQSHETFEAVTANLNIQGMTELQAACTSQPQMMAKMASIKRSMDEDAEYASAMTMTKLIAYIESHPHVHIDIVGSGSDRKLVFDPQPSRRFQIVKLLDDDFLRSVLTEREYEAGSKTQAG